MQVHLQVDFFPIINTTAVLHSPLWVESADVEEPHLGRADSKLFLDFWLCGEWVPLTPISFKGQLYFCLAVHSASRHLTRTHAIKMTGIVSS